MFKNKVESYMGFAARSRNLITGYNTCIMMMGKRKVKLLILCEDLAESTIEKMVSECKRNNVVYRIFGSSDDLSYVTGKAGKGIFGITDNHFAKIISKEIDLIQSER